jgi:four helix bundle protein
MKDEGREEEKAADLRTRLNEYALRVIRMYVSLEKKDNVAQVLGRQALKSGTSPGAHYREAGRARSDAEFISKMTVALQELDETDYWLGLLVHSGAVSEKRMQLLQEETNELIAIFTTIVKKTKGENS